MKKIILSIFVLIAFFDTFSQQSPTGTAINPNSTTGPLAANAWYRGGNLVGNTGSDKNVFGTMWNSPIYTVTNGVQRMRLNGSLNYSVNAYPAQPKDGYLLLGQTTQPSSQIFNNNNFGAFSMLHLNGSDNGTGVLQQGGLFTPEWIENRKRNQKERHSVLIVRLKVF